MLGTAPAATSTPARTTVIKARLIEIPPALGCTFLVSRVRMEQFRCNFRTRASDTEMPGIYSNRERSPCRY